MVWQLAVLKALGTKAVDLAASALGEKGNSVLGQRKERTDLADTLATAIRDAAGPWSTKHPQLVASGFDEFFLEGIAAELISGFLTPTGQPNGIELALRWVEASGNRDLHTRARRLDLAEGPAVELLAAVQANLNAATSYAEISRVRAEHRQALLADTRARLEGFQPVTAGTRRAYLRWVADQHGTLTTRGISQTKSAALALPLEEIYVEADLARSAAGDAHRDREWLRRLAMVEADSGVADMETAVEAMARELGIARVAGSDLPISPREAVESHARLVVLGDPGSGKTTALRWLALRNARAILTATSDGRGSTPADQGPVLPKLSQGAR